MHDMVRSLPRHHRDCEWQAASAEARADADDRSRTTPINRPATALTALFLTQVTERVAPPRAVFWEGDPASYIFHVLEGCLRVYRTRQDGRRAILGFNYPGDLVGVSFRDNYLFTAEAVTPVRIRRLARRRFHDLLDERPDLRPHLLAHLCDEMQSAQDHITRLGSTTAEERVATFLLHIAARSGSDAATPLAIEIPFGRLDIADHLGITVETVSREISKLKRHGVISTAGPHNIVLQRPGSLRDIARVFGDRRRNGAEFGLLSDLASTSKRRGRIVPAFAIPDGYRSNVQQLLSPQQRDRYRQTPRYGAR